MLGDYMEITWVRLDPFHGDGKNPNFLWGPSPFIPTHPQTIFLRGDAWGNAWGGYVGSVREGFISHVVAPLAIPMHINPHTGGLYGPSPIGPTPTS